jgi:osmotically-inducible protein OsmY
MQTKFNELTATGLSNVAQTVVPANQSLDDNFLLHLAPVSIGVFFFGNFHPNNEDKVQAQRALYKTSFLYRHFLQPGGLKTVIDYKTLTMTGKTTSATVSLMGQILATQIMGPVEVSDETTRQESLPGTGKAESAEDNERRARLQLMLATDERLCSEGIEISLSDGIAKVSGQVSSTENKTWAETLLRAIEPEAKFSLRVTTHKVIASTAKAPFWIDDDSLQALALTRLKLAVPLAALEFRAFSQRQGITLSGSVRNTTEKTLAESIAHNTYGLREFKSSLVVKN